MRRESWVIKPTHEFKIGVIIPVYNARPWIEEMLQSIKDQTYKVEAYLAEDLSDDGTYEFLMSRPDLYTAMARNEVRTGWPGSLNNAAKLALADGCDMIFTVSADDKLAVECIELCLERMIDGKYNFVIPYAQQFNGGDILQISYDDVTFDDLVVWPLMNDKALIRREVWEHVGGYSSDVTVPGTFGCAEDWDFWIKVWQAELNHYSVVKEPLYFTRVHPNQLSDSRGQYHAQTVEIFKAKHPDLPWTEKSGNWPPQHR